MTAAGARKLFLVGLRNAHAMEHQARELIERQIERSGDCPEVAQRLRAHLDETRTQIGRLIEVFEEVRGSIPS